MIKKAYFSLRDEVSKSTGYTRLELHELAKSHILPLLYDEEDCWLTEITNNNYPLSTRLLNEKGWELFFEEFKNLVINISR